MTTTDAQSIPDTMQQLRTLVTPDNTLELSIATVDTPTPGPEEVLVRVDAAPINPSDVGLLLGPADLSRAESSGSADSPTVTAPIPESAMGPLAMRVGQLLPAGNEGAGLVVAAGDSAAAQALLGRVVGFAGGATYSEYRAVPAANCLVMPDHVSPAAAASSFVNPLTALGMIETMRDQGHHALVHTAAASNLGQMLQRICLADGIDLVNVVRRESQATILRDLGAQWVCDSSSPTFSDDLTAALTATGATIAFDAIGGGPLAGQILVEMEAAAATNTTGYSRYGSDVHKQVYIYGGLDRGPTVLTRPGMAWGVSGWLLTPFLVRAGAEVRARLQQRVVAEIETTFASSYTDEVSLAGALDLEVIRAYARAATGQKFLIRPGLPA